MIITKKCKSTNKRFLKKVLVLAIMPILGSLWLQSCSKNNTPAPPVDVVNPLIISPTSVDMGMVSVDGVLAQRSVLLFNSGNTTVKINDYKIEGANAGSFKIKNIPGTSIKPVESTLIEVEYDPSSVNEETATLTANGELGKISANMVGKGTNSLSDIEFFRIFGIQDVEGFSLGIESNDKGFIFAGTSLIKGTTENTDVKVMKTDKNGAKVWEKLYGGDFSDSPAWIIQTTDGGYAIVGTTESFGVKNTDMYLIKIDSQGNEQWHKTYGGDDFENSSKILQTSDGGFIIFGSTRKYQSDALLIKTNSLGESVWQKTIGKAGGESIGDAIPKTDGQGYMMVGYTTSQDPTFENTDVWLVEIDNSGNVLKEKLYGNTNYESGSSIVKTIDGGYIIAGTQLSTANARQGYLLKIKSDYSMDWEKTYGGVNNDSFLKVKQLSDGGYIALGSSVTTVTTEHTYYESVVIKTNISGDQIKKQEFKGSRSVSYSSLEYTADKGFILAGTSDSYSISAAPIIMKLSSKF